MVVFGPVLSPPCHLQRLRPGTFPPWQGVPLRVRAPQGGRLDRRCIVIPPKSFARARACGWLVYFEGSEEREEFGGCALRALRHNQPRGPLRKEPTPASSHATF